MSKVSNELVDQSKMLIPIFFFKNYLNASYFLNKWDGTLSVIWDPVTNTIHGISNKQHKFISDSSGSREFYNQDASRFTVWRSPNFCHRWHLLAGSSHVGKGKAAFWNLFYKVTIQLPEVPILNTITVVMSFQHMYCGET